MIPNIMKFSNDYLVKPACSIPLFFSLSSDILSLYTVPARPHHALWFILEPFPYHPTLHFHLPDISSWMSYLHLKLNSWYLWLWGKNYAGKVMFSSCGRCLHHPGSGSQGAEDLWEKCGLQCKTIMSGGKLCKSHGQPPTSRNTLNLHKETSGWHPISDFGTFLQSCLPLGDTLCPLTKI